MSVTQIHHPALTVFGQRREDITVDEWATIVARLSERIADETQPSVRKVLIRQRMAALAFKDDAYRARENGITELLGAK